jgi:hypothetical protein
VKRKFAYGLCGVVAAFCQTGNAAPAGQEASATAASGFVSVMPDAPAGSDQLPNVQVGPVSVKNMPAFDALRIILERSGAGIGLTYRYGQLPASLRRPVAATNVEGRLPVLVEQLAKVAGFYYEYDASAKVVTVSEERQVSIALPADSAKAEAVKQQIAKLGGRDLAAGKSPGTLTYWAKRADAERIADYLGDTVAIDKGAAPVRTSSTSSRSAAVAHASWKLQAGDKISETFAQWGKTANWRVVWEVPELVAEADVALGGSFEDAVTEVIRALNRNGAALRHIFYEGNRMLRVTERKQ